jgi:hypothetical protein
VFGRFLFRWRGVIGTLAFGVVFWLARPTFGSCLLGVPLLVLGLAVRFWASGYVGVEGRVREIGARQRIASGPYRLLRHPLYIGNFVLVVGMLVALRPAVWLGAMVVVGFIVEYTMIVVAEEKDLAAKGKAERGNDEVAEEERDLTNGRGQKSEGRGQKAEVPMADSGGREAEGESFSLRRALCEWRTWVVTGVAWGLAVMKAATAS